MLDPEVYFRRRIVDDPDLEAYIPELVNVIKELKPLRVSSRKTSDYINHWLGSKVILEKSILVDGEDQPYFIKDPDLSLYNKFVRWMYYYFCKINNKRTGKTISYAFAHDEFVTRMNRSNGTVFENRPLPDLDEVIDEIETEESNTLPHNQSAEEGVESIAHNNEHQNEPYFSHTIMVKVWDEFNEAVWVGMPYPDFVKALSLVTEYRIQIKRGKRDVFFALVNELSKKIVMDVKREFWKKAMDQYYANGRRRVDVKDARSIMNNKNKDLMNFIIKI